MMKDQKANDNPMAFQADLEKLLFGGMAVGGGCKAQMKMGNGPYEVKMVKRNDTNEKRHQSRDSEIAAMSTRRLSRRLGQSSTEESNNIRKDNVKMLRKSWRLGPDETKCRNGSKVVKEQQARETRPVAQSMKPAEVAKHQSHWPMSNSTPNFRK